LVLTLSMIQHLPMSARLLLLGNAVLLTPALWFTTEVLSHPEIRRTALAVYRAPLLAVLVVIILLLVVASMRGNLRAIKWMLILFSLFVATLIWESATSLTIVEDSGIDLGNLGLEGWLAILWGPFGFVWFVFNFWYFYGRWGITPRIR
jgi:hypothetical protein